MAPDRRGPSEVQYTGKIMISVIITDVDEARLPVPYFVLTESVWNRIETNFEALVYNLVIWCVCTRKSES